MQAAILIAQILGGFVLIIFGAWVTWKGIGIITQYYPLTLKAGEPPPEAFSERGQPSNLVAAMMSLVNAEIASLASPKRTAAFVDLGNGDGTPGGAGNSTEVVPPGIDEGAEPEVEAPAETVPVTITESRDASAILEGAARVIESLPKLLNANFGPATVVCLVGMLIIAGGFYMLLKLNAGV